MSIKVDPTGEMESLNQLMSVVQDGYAKEINRIAKKLDVSDGVASDIWYLRTRSRWTQKLEDELIAAYRSGNPINSGDVLSGEWPYGHTSPLTTI